MQKVVVFLKPLLFYFLNSSLQTQIAAFVIIFIFTLVIAEHYCSAIGMFIQLSSSFKVRTVNESSPVAISAEDTYP